ncbi:MAG: quinohemoprotein ethanol dehydrogenase, partial [Gaiellaceae bacterium]|nr:quinohemoprotein ethanol dehydrogenase [Gaiellaceae bacterium]
MGRRRQAVIAVVALGVALTAATVGRGDANKSIPAVPAFTAAQLNAPAGDDWLTNGGSITNQRYSTLNQIDKSNVGKLKLAWKIHLHSGGTRAYSQEATPVVYKGVMYISTGNDDVFALDAATGKQLWMWHSHIPVTKITTACCGFSNRGVAIGDGKVFIALITGQLVALDQPTGHVVWRTWNTRWQEGGTMTLAPLYFSGKVIVGISGGEMGARGAVTAFDAKTGAQIWRFYTCPAYGDIGGGTWSGNEYQHCGAAVWSTPTVDPDRGLVY